VYGHPPIYSLTNPGGYPPIDRYIRIIDLAFALAAKSSKNESYN